MCKNLASCFILTHRVDVRKWFLAVLMREQMQVNYHFILHAQLSECVLRCSLQHSRDLSGILKCHYNEICVAVYVYMHACLPVNS